MRTDKDFMIYMNSVLMVLLLWQRDCGDPEEAFKSWLQKKQEQQLKEKQLEDMKRLEKESGFCLHSREESEKAFRQWVHLSSYREADTMEKPMQTFVSFFFFSWLRRKRAEKSAEQQAARERSRRLVLEERRARRMHDLLCTVNEIKPFRFSEPYGYRYWAHPTNFKPSLWFLLNESSIHQYLWFLFI